MYMGTMEPELVKYIIPSNGLLSKFGISFISHCDRFIFTTFGICKFAFFPFVVSLILYKFCFVKSLTGLTPSDCDQYQVHKAEHSRRQRSILTFVSPVSGDRL